MCVDVKNGLLLSNNMGRPISRVLICITCASAKPIKSMNMFLCTQFYLFAADIKTNAINNTEKKESPRNFDSNVSVEEPEFEFDDETGLELEAHDGEW